MNPFTPHFHIEGNIRRKTRSWVFLPPISICRISLAPMQLTSAIGMRVPSAGSGKTAFIDVRDIGAVAAKVMTEPGHRARPTP